MGKVLLSPRLERELRPPQAGPPPLQSFVPHETRFGVEIGAAMNLNLFLGPRFAAWNEYLRVLGGENVFRAPNYRLVWGWQRPHSYGFPDPSQLEFFHFERWVPMDLFCNEDEWYAGELAMKRHIPKYRVQPYPRQGDYVLLRTCLYGLCDHCHAPDCKCPNRFRRPHFRVPDEKWLEGAVVWDHYRRSRSQDQVAEEVNETEAFKKRLETEAMNKIQDEYGIRDLVEEETNLLIRNPSLRKEPDLLISPAVGKKRTRRRIGNTI